MIDWSASMQQTFEFYEVDPSTWKDKKKMTNIKSCTINRDPSAETLGSATFDVTESVGECYIRVYLVVTQDKLTEKFPLGTFLVQTPTSSFDGKIRDVSMDAYTPLLELKEKQPPIGYYIPKGDDVMHRAHSLILDNCRAPVSEPVIPSTALTCDFVADSSDTWLSFVSDLITAAHTSTCYVVEIQNGKYIRTTRVIEVTDGEKLDGVKTITNEEVYASDKSDTGYYCIRNNNTKYKLALDELGRILFKPEQDTASLQPTWTYTDDNSSILYPEISMNHDLYGIPNVVEVLYSDGDVTYYSKATNDDENSPISTESRGREIMHRITNPEIYGAPTQERIDDYAKQALRDLSSIEYTITYNHGYCPVKVGDCVRINYSRAGLTDVKAKVIYQSIKCVPGCPVTEKAIFTAKLWG